MASERQRDRSVIEDPVIVVGKISDLMILRFSGDEFIIFRSFYEYRSDIFCHTQSGEIRLEFDLSAPHLKLPYERIEVLDILGRLLDQKIFASFKSTVHFRAVSDRQDRDIFSLHIRNDTQILHGAHGRRDLTRTPEILSLKSLKKILGHIIRGLSEAVDIRAEDRTSGEESFKGLREEVEVLDDAVFIHRDHLDLGDDRCIEALICAFPSAFRLRIDEDHSAIHTGSDLRKTGLLCKFNFRISVHLLFFEYQKKRSSKCIVIGLSVDIRIRYEDLHVKIRKFIFPVLTAVYFHHGRALHHRHSQKPPSNQELFPFSLYHFRSVDR